MKIISNHCDVPPCHLTELKKQINKIQKEKNELKQERNDLIERVEELKGEVERLNGNSWEQTFELMKKIEEYKELDECGAMEMIDKLNKEHEKALTELSKWNELLDDCRMDSRNDVYNKLMELKEYEGEAAAYAEFVDNMNGN